MSWIRCDLCGELVNTDDDPGAFVNEDNPVWRGAGVVCESCREEMEEDDEQ